MDLLLTYEVLLHWLMKRTDHLKTALDFLNLKIFKQYGIGLSFDLNKVLLFILGQKF